jgi:hypothetical protein
MYLRKWRRIRCKTIQKIESQNWWPKFNLFDYFCTLLYLYSRIIGLLKWACRSQKWLVRSRSFPAKVVRIENENFRLYCITSNYPLPSCLGWWWKANLIFNSTLFAHFLINFSLIPVNKMILFDWNFTVNMVEWIVFCIYFLVGAYVSVGDGVLANFDNDKSTSTQWITHMIELNTTIEQPKTKNNIIIILNSILIFNQIISESYFMQFINLYTTFNWKQFYLI